MNTNLDNLTKFILNDCKGYVAKSFECPSTSEFYNIVDNNQSNIDTFKNILKILDTSLYSNDIYFILLKEFINEENTKKYLTGKKENNNYIFNYSGSDISEFVIRLLPIFDVQSSILYLRIDSTLISAVYGKDKYSKVKVVVS